MLRGCALAMLLAACGSTPQPTPPAGRGTPAADGLVSASLQRKACYGFCPVYKVSVSRDGTVVYEGENFVKLVGRHEGKVTAGQLDALAAAFDAAGFWSMNDAYTSYDVTDSPGAILSCSTTTRSKQIDHYHGDQRAPQALTRLENEFDRIVNIEQWIGTADERQRTR